MPPLLRCSLLLACIFCTAPAWSDPAPSACTPDIQPPCPAPSVPLDPIELEKALQSLTWEQLVQVFQAVPKLREQYERLSDFERSILQQRYAHHAWRRNVAKLDDTQRVQLAELIGRIKAGTSTMQ